MDCSTPGFPVHHQLPELTQTHVHRVGDAIQPSHPLSAPSPPTFNLSQHQGLFQWVSSSHQVAKVLEFQLQHQSFQWIFMNVIKVKLVGSWFDRVNVLIRRDMRGLPWQSSSQDSVLPKQGVQVWSLVGELRSHTLCSLAKQIFFFKKGETWECTPLLPMQIQWEGSYLQVKKGNLTGIQLYWHPEFTLPASRTGETFFSWLSHPVHGILLWQPKPIWINTHVDAHKYMGTCETHPPVTSSVSKGCLHTSIPTSFFEWLCTVWMSHKWFF